MKLDKKLLCQMGFITVPKNHEGILFKHSRFELYVFKDHTTEQVVRNYLCLLVHFDNIHLNLSEFLKKIY